uniref:Uncharacterized protein n=1 Tax=Setaria italica TaxID=4555 RepID=K4ANR8_SETIT
MLCPMPLESDKKRGKRQERSKTNQYSKSQSTPQTTDDSGYTRTHARTLLRCDHEINQVLMMMNGCRRRRCKRLMVCAPPRPASAISGR